MKLRESLPGCIGTGKPVAPNRCGDCKLHSEPRINCADVKIVRI